MLPLLLVALAGCFSCPSHERAEAPPPPVEAPPPPRLQVTMPTPYDMWGGFPVTGAEIKDVSVESHRIVLAHASGKVDDLTQGYVNIAVRNGWNILADPVASGSGSWHLSFPKWEAHAQEVQPDLDATGGLRIKGEVVGGRPTITLDYGLLPL